MRIRRITVALAAVLTLLLSTTGPADAVDVDGSPTFQEDQRALWARWTTPPVPGHPQGIYFIYEIAVDQLSYRNGDSHKAWFIPESNKGLIVFARDVASGTPITPPPNPNPRCPFSGPGSDSFTDEDVPITCTWRIGAGPNRVTGEFELIWKGVAPGAQALAAAAGNELNEITLSARTFDGTFTHAGVDYTVSVDADRVRFRNGSTHREFVIPESHKVDDGGFSGDGVGWQVRCPISSPGVDVVDGAGGTITCTWKAGFGSGKPTGTVVLD